MDRHSRFEDIIERGNYWFHLHTTVTDGKLEAADYAAAAKNAGVQQVIFLEHIRRQPTYDVAAFASAAREACESQGVQPLVGFEAKVLPDGSLDISDRDLERADVVGIAEHGWQKRSEPVEKALLRSFELFGNRRTSCPVVWAHPGTSRAEFQAGQPRRGEYLELLREASRSGIWLERNLKYGLLDESAQAAVRDCGIVIGGDCHTREDLKRFDEVPASDAVLSA